MINYDLIHQISSPDHLAAEADRLRAALNTAHPPTEQLLTVFDAWSNALSAPALRDIKGLAFLRLWLKSNTLRALIHREFGISVLDSEWEMGGRVQLKPYPVGIVGHWPAANIDIQPILSMVCSLLGGNTALVRIPSTLFFKIDQMIAQLIKVDNHQYVSSRISLVSFPHERTDLQEVMAKHVDGAMIWGSEESVLAIRSLPFAHWCRIAVFGPRISAAVMDMDAWKDPELRKKWCQRLARDVWQFEQQACSSPQTLFVEKSAHLDISVLLVEIKLAFEEENRLHPRTEIFSGNISNIVLGRASWLMKDPEHRAIFPLAPDWSILVGNGNELPDAIQGRTLFVMQVDDLREAVKRMDGNVQTLGLAFGDPGKEIEIIEIASRRGVDRMVKIGRMHVFDSPWDGKELIKPMTRITRYLSSLES